LMAGPRRRRAPTWVLRFLDDSAIWGCFWRFESVGFVENWKCERLQQTGCDLVKIWRQSDELTEERMEARVGFVWCSGGERKCGFYSGRRVVIDYRVCVIDYDVTKNIAGGPESSVIDYRV